MGLTESGLLLSGTTATPPPPPPPPPPPTLSISLVLNRRSTHTSTTGTLHPHHGSCSQRDIYFLKFIIHILDGTHLFVSSNVDGMIRSAIQEFREKNTYEKPA